MERLFDYGSFGAFYGARLFAIANTAYNFYHLLLEWPAGGMSESMVEGLILISIVSVVMGYGFGFVGGFIFGLIASTSESPFIWALGGMMGGLVFALLYLGFLCMTVLYHPIGISYLLPLLISPTVLMGIMGYAIGRCLNREHPRLPRSDWIRLERNK